MSDEPQIITDDTGYVALCREEYLPSARAALARDGHPDIPVVVSPHVPGGQVLLFNTALLDEETRAVFHAAIAHPPPRFRAADRWYWQNKPTDTTLLGGA